MSSQEAGSFERSFYDEEANRVCLKAKSLFEEPRKKNGHETGGMEEFRNYENFGIIGNVEGPIEASVSVEESLGASSSNDQLDEVTTYLQPALISVQGIREKFIEKLNQQHVSVNQLNDFNLGLMDVLNDLDKGYTVEKFLQQAYVGCFQCLLCLHCDKELSKSSQRLGNHLSNALSVLGHVVSERGASLPDLTLEQRKYDECELQHLIERTNQYLQHKSGFLKRNAELIKDFQVISEMDSALTHLQVEIEELKRNPHEVSRFDSFMLFSEMEKTTDFSWSC